jgi:hypothetical protein
LVLFLAVVADCVHALRAPVVVDGVHADLRSGEDGFRLLTPQLTTATTAPYQPQHPEEPEEGPRRPTIPTS